MQLEVHLRCALLIEQNKKRMVRCGIHTMGALEGAKLFDRIYNKMPIFDHSETKVGSQLFGGKSCVTCGFVPRRNRYIFIFRVTPIWKLRFETSNPHIHIYILAWARKAQFLKDPVGADGAGTSIIGSHKHLRNLV